MRITIANTIPGIMKRWPPNLPRLGAWFEADFGVATSGANITSITDRSPNGYVCIPDAVSPTLVAGVYNGNPTMRFVTASAQALSRAATNLWGTGAYSIYVLSKPSVASNNCALTGSWNASGGAGAYMNGIFRTAAHPAVAAFDDGNRVNALELWSITRAAGAKPQLYLANVGSGWLPVEQVLSGAATTMADAGPTAKLCIGGGFGANTFDGDIPAILMYNTNHNLLNVQYANAYITHKYVGTP